MYRYIFGIILLLLLPATALCSISDWQWSLEHWVCVGTSRDASDSLDSLDLPMAYEPWTYHVAVYEETGVNGWNEASGFYRHDLRSPLTMVPGASKTWRIYLWGDMDYPSQTIGLSWFPGVGISQEVLEGIEFRLTYVRPAVGVVDDTHTVGDYWIFNDYPDGSGTGGFPACKVANGLDGYIFDFTATMIPEPSSLLALGAGGLGLLEAVLRRRRRG